MCKCSKNKYVDFMSFNNNTINRVMNGIHGNPHKKPVRINKKTYLDYINTIYNPLPIVCKKNGLVSIKIGQYKLTIPIKTRYSKHYAAQGLHIKIIEFKNAKKLSRFSNLFVDNVFAEVLDKIKI